MNRERIEELAVSYSTGELDGQDLADFKAWRSTAPAEELTWFAAIVDGAAILVAGSLEPVVPSPDLKGKIMATLGLDGKDLEDPEEPDFSFVMGGDHDGEWTELPVPGARIRVLSDNEDDGHTIFVLELDPGTTFPAHGHHGAESAYVLSGDIEIEGRFLRAGDFSRAAPGSQHRSLFSRDGCRALLVTSYENFHDN